MTAIEWMGIGVLVVLAMGALVAVVLTAIEKEPRVIKGSELQKTKEGRELLVGFQDAGRTNYVPLTVLACRDCEGSGLKIGEFRHIMGQYTNMYLCEACGGSGLEGGTDYRVEYCKPCSERGQIVNSCPSCSGTGVMKVKKENKENG